MTHPTQPLKYAQGTHGPPSHTHRCTAELLTWLVTRMAGVAPDEVMGRLQAELEVGALWCRFCLGDEITLLQGDEITLLQGDEITLLQGPFGSPGWGVALSFTI